MNRLGLQTPLKPLTSFDERIRLAIANRRLIGVRYKGADRIAEPHDYGVLGGVTRLFVYQLRGPARPGHAAEGWRQLDLEKIESLDVLDGTFPGSRGESHRAHLQWEVLYARVS